MGIRQHPPTGLFPELSSRYDFDWISVDSKKSTKIQCFYQNLSLAGPARLGKYTTAPTIRPSKQKHRVYNLHTVHHCAHSILWRSPAMARLSQADLAELNRTFDDRSPQELLLWARDIFGDRIAALTSMQEAGNVVCHMLHSVPVPMPVVFVDTGVLFQETLDTRDRLAQEYGLTIRTLTPALTMQQQTEQLGILYLTPEGQKQCCELRKNEPLDTVRGQYDAMIGSLRRADGGRRGSCPILAVDTRLNLLRINVLANFEDEQMDAYIRTHNVILNPLHKQGYSTIGCNRCTTPVLPGEPKRAGRWRHLGPWSVYCGINPTDLDPQRAPAVDFPQDLIDRILGRSTDFMI
jgi:phosphoadenosine phosphosulfate reductase